MRIFGTPVAAFVASSAGNGVNLTRVRLDSSSASRSVVLFEECRLQDVAAVVHWGQHDFVITSKGAVKLRREEFGLKTEGLLEFGRAVLGVSIGGCRAAFLVQESRKVASLVFCDLDSIIEGNVRNQRPLLTFENLEGRLPRFHYCSEDDCVLLTRDQTSIDVVFLKNKQCARTNPRFINCVDELVEFGMLDVGGKRFVAAIGRSGKFLARRLKSSAVPENSAPKILDSNALVGLISSKVHHAVAFRDGFLVADATSLWRLRIDGSSGEVSASVYKGKLSERMKFLRGATPSGGKIACLFSSRTDRAVLFVDPSSKADFCADTRTFSRSSIAALGRDVLRASERATVTSFARVASGAEKELKLAETLRSGLASDVFKLESLGVSGESSSKRVRIEVKFKMEDAGLSLLRVAALNAEPSVFWWLSLICDFNDGTTTWKTIRLTEPWSRRQSRSFSVFLSREKLGSALVNFRPVTLNASLGFYFPQEMEEGDKCSMNRIEVSLLEKQLAFEDLCCALKCQKVETRFDLFVRHLTPVPAFKKFGRLFGCVDDLVDLFGPSFGSRHGHLCEVAVSESGLLDLRLRLGFMESKVVCFQVVAGHFVTVSWACLPESKIVILGVDSDVVAAVAKWINKMVPT